MLKTKTYIFFIIYLSLEFRGKDIKVTFYPEIFTVKTTANQVYKS